MSEQLHATNAQGLYVKTDERAKLLAEIRSHARAHGEAPVAVPVVHIILTNSAGEIRMVQRGDKAENPYMWDKAVGGHVVTEDTTLSRQAFDDNARKEAGEEIGIHDLLIAADPIDYRRKLQREKLDLNRQALLYLLDHDPWQGTICISRDDGKPWLKRNNAAIYTGLYDGPFVFEDGEAVDQRAMSLERLATELQQSPWQYADGVRVFMQRYAPLLGRRPAA
ncbi:MAG: NUDIX domain-containing protein [Magnetococcales bacterium]|nr:NUDIX domain-containing protein [Magnetococcales bacterium]